MSDDDGEDSLLSVPVVSSSWSSGDQSEQEIALVLCDYCQQPSKPFICREQLENNPDLDLSVAEDYVFLQTINSKQTNASNNGPV